MLIYFETTKIKTSKFDRSRCKSNVQTFWTLFLWMWAPDFVFTQYKWTAIKFGLRFNFWISYPLSQIPEKLACFKAIFYSVAHSLWESRSEKKKKNPICFIPVNQELTGLDYDENTWVIFWVVTMDLTTEATGGWGWLSSAPHAGLKPVAELETAESRGFLQVGSTLVQALLQCSRWTSTEQWGEMDSLQQGWGWARHRPVLLSSHLQQHSVLPVGVGGSAQGLPCIEFGCGWQRLWRHWWDEWVFLIASLPAAGEVWDIFHSSCCCLWPSVLLSAAVLPWGLRKAPWVTVHELLFLIATGRPLIDSSAG